jgi:glycosyltransferase involved in cell wall biosynthesis
MRITFLMPGYSSAPSGGFRVVYEYANRLVSRGHRVVVVQPRRLKFAPASEPLTAKRRIRDSLKNGLKMLRSKTAINWQPVDPRVELLLVPHSGSRYMPDADVIFATSWHTVQSILECPEAKGEKCYFIQGYESYHAAKDLVDDTWRAPLHKIVIAKWLVGLGTELGCGELTYIPNAINHDLYRLTQPIEGRSRQVSMLFSTTQIKGSADGIEALKIIRENYAAVKVVFFGVSRPQSWIPEWVEYHRNPPQDFLINEIYNKSSVYLAPSWTEGSPLPPAEAAACGCAVVATNIGGFREYIEDGVTGLLSPPQEPTGLAENIGLLLGNEPLRVRLAKACNSYIASLSWERSADLFEDFLEDVTSDRSVDLQGVVYPESATKVESMRRKEEVLGLKTDK